MMDIASVMKMSQTKQLCFSDIKIFIIIFFRYHFSFDVRGRQFSKALYWSDTSAFGPRAYFVTVSNPAALSVDNIQLDDEGVS